MQNLHLLTHAVLEKMFIFAPNSVLRQIIFLHMDIMNLTIQGQEKDLVQTYWDKLSNLSLRAKLQLASLLTASALDEANESDVSTQTRRTGKVRRRALNSPSDAQLESRFAGTEVPVAPEDPSWSQVISSNTGKTIKPIEKWL